MKKKTRRLDQSGNNYVSTTKQLSLATVAFSLGLSVAQGQSGTLSPALHTTPGFSTQPLQLPEMVVTGREDSLVGIAESASQGTIGAAQLQLRPSMRTGELLEAVPGLIITQHAGGGKANQYFLRGFNLDHGTDFATTLDGMPLNMPSHGHGQGWTDMNIVIPELVSEINYQKGVYYAENGDFSSAGAAHLEYFKTVPQSIATVEGGMYGYGRAFFASSPQVGQGHLLYGLEASHHDGPWENPDDYQKFNGITTYSQGDNSQGFSITARGYHGKWDSSDQVAQSAISNGLIPFYGSLDDTTGGDSQRYSLEAEWHRANAESATHINIYTFYNDLDLFSNFTYFLVDADRGDQFEQTDKRITEGLHARHTLFEEWSGMEMEHTFGMQVRNDNIENGLFNTEGRRRVDKIDSNSGEPIPATVREDEIGETSVGLYYENKVQWAEKFRTIAGIRGDIYHFDVDSSLRKNSGSRTDAMSSPKLTLVFGPWAKTEVYLQGGLGFHSNDARGVTSRVDPLTGSEFDADGNRIQPADPLAQTYGAELGVRTTFIPGLQSSLSFWWLDIDSELLFVGDAGSTEASRPSRRYGVEFANYYQLTTWLSVDADFSLSHGEFRDNDPAGDYIPGSIESVIAAGITAHDPSGLFASLRLRYFGPRPLIEDNSARSSESILVGAQVGYHFNKHWTASAEVFNVLNRKDHDIDYFYESRVSPVAAATEQIHFHPVEPIQVRFALTARF
ncbi:MAG: TonB-dependent receptor [Verrucomicrobiales bacterium]